MENFTFKLFLKPKSWLVMLLFLIMTTLSFGQTTYTWDGSAPDGNWMRGTNSGPRWNPGTLWDQPPGGNTLLFNSNHQNTMTNNVGAGYNVHKITFGSGNSTSRTIGGNSVNFFESGATWPRIQNDATNTVHTINFPFNASTNSGFNMELIANAGPLVFGGTINNNGREIRVQGNGSAIDGTNRYIQLGGVVSGSGALNIFSKGAARLTAAHTYTGSTIVNDANLTLGIANALPITASAGLIQFSGGTPVFDLGLFNLGSSTAAANSAGALDFDVNTTINLGASGSNTYYFKDSSGQTWLGSTITINNWTGTAGATGATRKIFVGSAATHLTAGQLAKINFAGYANGAVLLSTGELVPVAAPVITVSTASLTAFADTCSGAFSSEQSFTVSGATLTANITVTAPSTDFQVSTTSGSGFGSSVTLTQSGGNVSTTTIFVRFSPQSSGAKSGNITATSTGATTRNIAVSGNAPAPGTYSYLRTLTASATINQGSNATLEGEGFAAGFTEPAGQAVGSIVEFGYKNANTDPTSDATWIWATATFDRANGNNDLLRATSFGSALGGGIYYYTFRFKLTTCSAWQYTGTSSTVWSSNSGVLTVRSAPVLAATTAASSITSTTATSGGNVTSDGLSAITERGIVFNTSSNPTTANTKVIVAGTTGSFSANMTGLLPGTVYYVRAYAINAVNTSYGTEISFTTAVGLPTLAATSINSNIIASTSASIASNVTSAGGGTVTERGIVYATTTTPTTSDTKITNGTGTGTYNTTTGALTPGTFYYVRSYAINSAGTEYGAQTTFTTLMPPTSQTAVSAGPTSINLAWTRWTGDRAGVSTPYNVMVVRSTDASFTQPTNTTSYTVGNTSLGGDTVIYNNNGTSFTDTGLTVGVTYFYAFYSEGFTYYSSAATASAVPSTVISGAKIGVNFNSGGATWRFTGAQDACDLGSTGWSGTSLGSLFPVNSIVLVGANLVSGTGSTSPQLFYRVYRQGDTPPSFSSANLNTTTAACGAGTKYESAGLNITIPPATYVTPGTYNFEVYHQAVNGGTLNMGTSGSPITATFIVSTPLVPTLAATNAADLIGATIARSGGNVTGDGGGTVTVRGIVCGTSSNPVVGGGGVITTTDGSGTGTFTSSITGLTAGTLYYVRAYATNSTGPGYGTQTTFTPLSSPTAQTAVSGGLTSINLAWTKWTGDRAGVATSYNVMVVRSTDAAFTQPSNGSSYIVGDTSLGGDRVVYNNNGTSFTDTGLVAGTTYHYAFYSEGFTYYSVRAIASVATDSPSSPSVSTTDAATSIGSNSATSGGNITSDGGSAITERGIVFSTTASPTIANSKVVVAGTTGTFTANLIGLTPLTLYYVRAFATNGVNTTYGPQITFTTINPTYSAKAFFKLNGAATQYYGCRLDTGCDPGQTSDLVLNNIPLIGTLIQGQNFQIGGNLLQFGTIYSNATMHYRIYKSTTDDAPPAYSSITLNNVGAPGCNAAHRKWERIETATTITAGNNSLGVFQGDGTYFVQIYFSGVSGSAFDWYLSGLSGFTAKFDVRTVTPLAERDPNDANYNPNASANLSGMFESYMGVLVRDINGVPIPGLNRVFDMDGALSSINNSNFDFGIQDPGLTFNVGTETKVFTKGTHRICGCSSWSYVYDIAKTANPVESDFPLPPAGALFTSQINGKFTLLNTSVAIASLTPNQPFVNTTTPVPVAFGSTSDAAYNTTLGATITKLKDYLDPVVGTVASINNPVNPIQCPTCSGDYRVAIAMLAWISTTNDCTNESSLIYHRDINKNKVTDAGVVLNPNHNDASTTTPPGNDSKNSLPGTSIFYVSKVKVGASDGTKVWKTKLGVTGWYSFTTDLLTTPPTEKNDITFSVNYSTTTGSGIRCNDMRVNNGVVVTIAADSYIEALNDVITTGTGKIVIHSTGNLVQRCDEKLELATIEHLKVSGLKRKWDYEYWASPIDQNMFTSKPSPFDIGYFRQAGAGGGWRPLTPAGVSVGRGFILRVSNTAPWNATPTATTWQINGTANNGIVTIPVVQEDYATTPLNYNNSELLGNPYPCAVDGQKFLEDPSNLILDGYLSFWTSATLYPGTGLYQEPDYAIWNLTGTTQVANGLTPNGKIPSGQGFFVKVKSNGNVVFKDYMRSTNQNTMFFRKANNSLDRYWISLTNGNKIENQILIGHLEGATNNMDRLYDAAVNSVSPVQIYSFVNENKVSINGRASFTPSDEIPLGILAVNSDLKTLTITLSHKEGIFADGATAIYLYDNQLKIYHNLQESPYTFVSNETEVNNRFKIVYQYQSLGNTTFDGDGTVAIAYIINNKLNISSNENILKATVYDISGRIIAEYNNKVASKKLSSDFNNSKGIYIAKITLENGKTVSQKLMN